MDVDYQYSASLKRHTIKITYNAQELVDSLEPRESIPNLPSYTAQVDYLPYVDQLSRKLLSMDTEDYGVQ